MKMMIPPIVGVPAFAWWPAGPSSRMCWPNSRSRRNAMNFGDEEDADEQRGRAGDEDLAHQAPSSASATTSRPTPRERLDEHGVARRAASSGHDAAAACASASGVTLAVAVGHVRGARPDGDEHVDARSRGRGRRSPRGSGLVGPELEHVAEHGDAAPGRGRGEVVEGGAHRHRVGVVAVVDDDDPAGQLDPLAAQARQRDVDQPVGLDADGARGGQRGAARCGACGR